MKQYIVNAFAEEGYIGNPAAVRIMDTFPPDCHMQQIALENNLSETAFCVCLKDDAQNPIFHIRWFTPGCEVELCGHATLATSYILFKYYFKEAQILHFQSKSGELRVSREWKKNKKTDTEFFVMMDFPAYTLEKVTDPTELDAVKKAISPLCPEEIWKGIDYVALLKTPKDVIDYNPDFEKIKALPNNHNLLITSANNNSSSIYHTSTTQHKDFISRCFFPKEAIDEDPVTGSAHCSLGPLWAKKLNRSELIAYQASARGGILHLRISANRVLVGGKAIEIL